MPRSTNLRAKFSSSAAVALTLALVACSEPTAAPRAASIILTPLADTLAIGSTQQLAVTVLGASGSTLSGMHVDWSSSATSVATVSSAGIVSAIAAGTATITATVQDISRSATVVVQPPDCGAPTSTSLSIGTPRSGAMSDAPCTLFDFYTAVGYPLTVSSLTGMRFTLNANGFSGGVVITDTDNTGIIGFPPGIGTNTFRAVLPAGQYRVYVLSSTAPSASQTFTLSSTLAAGDCESTTVTRALDLGNSSAAAVSDDSCILLGGPAAEGWRIVLTEPTRIRASASSAAFPPTVAITSADYSELISFSIGAAPGSVNTIAALPAGEYLVWGGSFDLLSGTVQVAVDTVAACVPSGVATLGTPVNGLLEATDCLALSRPSAYADVWTLTLPDTTTVDVALTSAAFDTFLELRSAADELIAYNDDDAISLNSRLVHTLAPGTYRIWATSYLGAVTGAYTLSAAVYTGGALNLERATQPNVGSAPAKPSVSSESATPGWPAARPWPARRSGGTDRR